VRVREKGAATASRLVVFSLLFELGSLREGSAKEGAVSSGRANSPAVRAMKGRTRRLEAMGIAPPEGCVLSRHFPLPGATKTRKSPQRTTEKSQVQRATACENERSR